MKKSLLIVIAVLACALLILLPSCQKEEPDIAYVTVVNEKPILVKDDVILSDADGDGVITVSDVLYLAHEEDFVGGAALGYASEPTEYGFKLTKLWGIDNGGNFGFIKNNVPCMSLSDSVNNGDHLVAYVYTDTDLWSDSYAYFDTTEVTAGTINLTLMMHSYDEAFNVVPVPVEGAYITIDGINTKKATDENGKVIINAYSGAVISAFHESLNLVAPVCIVK